MTPFNAARVPAFATRPPARSPTRHRDNSAAFGVRAPRAPGRSPLLRHAETTRVRHGLAGTRHSAHRLPAVGGASAHVFVTSSHKKETHSVSCAQLPPP